MLLLFIIGSAGLLAADWPSWRGARRDGHAEGFAAPASWPKGLGVRWELAVGEGHASPVVVGDVVFLFSRQGEAEVLRAIGLEQGKVLWRVEYPAPHEMNEYAKPHGPGPKSTPTHVESAAGGRVITLGIGGTLTVFAAKSGATQWRKDFASELKVTAPEFGTAMTPLVVDELVIAHVGGPGKGFLRAFDLASGDVRWSLDGDGPAYASPVLAELRGTRQVLTQTQSRLVSVALKDGKLLWSLPFTTQYDQNSVTLLVANDLVVYSGYQLPVKALRIVGGDPSWSVQDAWSNPEVSQFMSSPILHGGLIFGHSMKQKGQLFCLDAATGKTHWKGSGRRGENAALVNLGSVIAVLTDEAQLLFLAPTTSGEEVVASYQVASSPTWAHPVFVAGGVLIKDKTKLKCLRLSE